MLLRSPSRAPHSLVARPTTVDMFAYRAAAAADLADVDTLDVGVEAGTYRRFFRPDRYRTLAAPRPASKRRTHYHGFVPRQPIDVLPLASSCVGLVFCPDVIERSPDPQGFMVELTRVLQPDGRLFFFGRAGQDKSRTGQEQGREQTCLHRSSGEPGRYSPQAKILST